MNGRPVVVGAVAALAIAALGLGCSKSEDSTPTSTQPVGTASATTTARTSTSLPATIPPTTSKWTPDQQQAIDAYLAYADAYHSAQIAGSGGSPELQAHAAGEFLTSLQVKIATRKAAGAVVKRPDQSITREVVRAADLRDGIWQLDTCEVNDFLTLKASDGTVLDDSVGTHLQGVALELIEGSWKVTGTIESTKWPGDEMDTCLAN